MASDGLMMKGARASATMMLTMLNRNTSVWHVKGWWFLCGIYVTKKWICLVCHFSTQRWCSLQKFYLMGDKKLFILRSPYQGCSWPGDWSQGISSHGTCLSCIVHTKSVHGLVTGARTSAAMVHVHTHIYIHTYTDIHVLRVESCNTEKQPRRFCSHKVLIDQINTAICMHAILLCDVNLFACKTRYHKKKCEFKQSEQLFTMNFEPLTLSCL